MHPREPIYEHHTTVTACTLFKWISAITVSAALLCLQIMPAAGANKPDLQTLLNMKQDTHRNGTARYIDTQELQRDFQFTARDFGTRARRVIAFYRNQLRLRDPARQLAVTRVQKDMSGNRHVGFRQRHRGVPVAGAELRVHFGRRGKPTSVTGVIVPDIDLSTQPSLSAQQAGRLAVAEVASGYSTRLAVRDAGLVIYNDGLVRGRPGQNHLAYRITVVGNHVREFLFVSATDGAILDRFTGVHSARNRLTYDMHNSFFYFAAILERAEADPPTGDADVDNAHDFAGDTYDFFFNAYGRDSIDDNGLTMRSYTHFNLFICPNAFWDGRRVTYCDGFPADDVAAHEFTHGLTENSAGLFYFFQPGALNESLSDIFGEVVDQINLKGTDTPAVKWLLGEDLSVFGAIRDMSDPTVFGDPDRVSHPNYSCGFADNGGVHINSGVPNKNFYLLTEGGAFNGQTIQPLGLTKAAAIHYQAVTNYLTPATRFPGYFFSLWRSCQDLIGVDLPDPTTGSPSGEVLTFGECVNVLRAGLAVEFLAPSCS